MNRFRPRAAAFLFCAIALLFLTGIYQRVASPSLIYPMDEGAASSAEEHDHPPLTPEDSEKLAQAMTALQKDPENVDRLLSIAHIFSRNKDWMNAIGFLDRATHLAPNDMRPQYFLGLAFASTGDHFKAEKSFEQALGIAPGNPQAMFNLAVLYRYHLGKPEKADELFRAVAISPMTESGLRESARRQIETPKPTN